MARAASWSRSGVASGPSRPGCRGSRRSRPGTARGGGAGRIPPDARPIRGGTRGRAHRARRSRAGLRPVRPVDRQDPDVGRPRPATPGLGVAGVDEQPSDPGFEAVRIAERRELAPGRDEGALQGVLREVGVAQDPRADRVQPVAGRADQDANASRSPSRARTTNLPPGTTSVPAPVASRSPPMSVTTGGNVQITMEIAAPAGGGRSSASGRRRPRSRARRAPGRAGSPRP